MFHTYHPESAGFQEWLKATDQLYQLLYLEMGGRKKEYRPLKVDAHPQDQFLLYIDDEAGVCGSAVITALPYDFEVSNHLIPEGTLTLRNVFFHLRAGHPIHEQPDKFRRLVEHFHLGLFEYLWERGQQQSQKIVLSLQTDLDAHEDLQFFGGFTFQDERFEEDEKDLAIGVILLNASTYEAYAHKKKAHLGQTDVYLPLLLKPPLKVAS